MVLDFRRLTRAEAIAGIAGVGLIVALLAFKWYGIKSHNAVIDPATFATGTVEGDTRNAFQSFTVVDVVILAGALAAIGLALGAAAGASPRLLLLMSAFVAILGIASIALIAFRLVDPPDLEIAAELQMIGNVDPPETLHVSDFPDTEVTRKIGVWLGLVAASIVTWAGLSNVVSLRSAAH